MKILRAGLVVFGLMAGTAAMGQERGGKSPQERAQFRTAWMAKELSLTEDQQAKITDLNIKSIEKSQAVKNDSSLSAEQKKEAWKANHETRKAAMKEILTAEQLAAIEAKRAEKIAKRKAFIEKHGEHKSKKGSHAHAKSRMEWMTKELSLSPEQQSKLSELNTATEAKKSAIRKDSSLTKDQRAAAFKSIREEYKTSLSGILTPEQQKTLSEKKQAHKPKHGEKMKEKKK